jgi:hypothetical protein
LIDRQALTGSGSASGAKVSRGSYADAATGVWAIADGHKICGRHKEKNSKVIEKYRGRRIKTLSFFD